MAEYENLPLVIRRKRPSLKTSIFPQLSSHQHPKINAHHCKQTGQLLGHNPEMIGTFI